MKKSLGQRIIAGVLSLAMALTMFPTTVLAASSVSRNYARIGSLKNDTLIASAANGRVTYVGNYAYGENMYLMFALPQNASRVSLRIDGPVSGTLIGYNYRGHVTQSGTTANPIYKSSGISTTGAIQAMNAVAPGQYMPLSSIPGIGVNGTKTSSSGNSGSTSTASNMSAGASTVQFMSLGIAPVALPVANETESEQLLEGQDGQQGLETEVQTAPASDEVDDAPEGSEGTSASAPAESEAPDAAAEVPNGGNAPSETASPGTDADVTPAPTVEPTTVPTVEPTTEPTAEPTPVPTAAPTPAPTATLTPEPTATPNSDENSEPDQATAETAETEVEVSQGDMLTPEEIIEKVIAEFNLTEEQTADMDIQQYIALALELGIELDDDFYSYFDTVMPSPMAVDDKPSVGSEGSATVLYNYVAWNGMIMSGGKRMYPTSGEYTITITSPDRTYRLQFVVPDNGQDDLIGDFNESGTGESLTEEELFQLYEMGITNPIGDKTGNYTVDKVTGGDPVDMITGALEWNYTDLSIEGDKQMVFNRSYNSRQRNQDTAALGNGWSHNYNYVMEIYGEDVILHLPNGGSMQFAKDGSADEAGDWRTDNSNLYTLTETENDFLLADGQGMTVTFVRQGDNVAYGMLVTEADGSTTTLTYDGDKLTSVATDTGTFTFGYEGDHISSVTDSSGRTVTYSYNGDDLATSVNPDGDSLQFAYNDEHMY